MFKYIFCFILSVFTSSSPCRKDQFAVSYCSVKWPAPSQLSISTERLSEKVHAKGIVVCGLECSVIQRNLKEWHLRPWTYVCEC